jgi:hypothetical protein
MDTSPNKERETLDNESNQEIGKQIFLTLNDTHPEFDIWAAVYFTDDQPHVPVTVLTFTSKGSNEIVFRLPK